MRNQITIKQRRDIKAEKEAKAKDKFMEWVDIIIFWVSYTLVVNGVTHIIMAIHKHTKLLDAAWNNEVGSLVLLIFILMGSYMLTKELVFGIHKQIMKHVKL